MSTTRLLPYMVARELNINRCPKKLGAGVKWVLCKFIKWTVDRAYRHHRALWQKRLVRKLIIHLSVLPPTPSEYIGLAKIVNVDQFLHSYTTNGSYSSCMHVVPYFLPWYITVNG